MRPGDTRFGSGSLIRKEGRQSAQVCVGVGTTISGCV